MRTHMTFPNSIGRAILPWCRPRKKAAVHQVLQHMNTCVKCTFDVATTRIPQPERLARLYKNCFVIHATSGSTLDFSASTDYVHSHVHGSAVLAHRECHMRSASDERCAAHHSFMVATAPLKSRVVQAPAGIYGKNVPVNSC